MQAPPTINKNEFPKPKAGIDKEIRSACLTDDKPQINLCPLWFEWLNRIHTYELQQQLEVE